MPAPPPPQPTTSTPATLSTIVLHIEELTKQYYDVKTKHGRTHRKKYYDVDWRFYIAHKYGHFVLCGTRCPMYDTYNEEWPIISTSFVSAREVFEYISLLIGENKINTTLFVSESKAELVSGSTYIHSDLAFSHPTNKRFRALDADRKNRRNELVGYDHFRLSPTTGCSEFKVVRLLKMMSVLNNGGMIPFTISPHPSSLQNWRQCCPQQAQQTQQTQQPLYENGAGYDDRGDGNDGDDNDEGNEEALQRQENVPEKSGPYSDDEYYDYVSSEQYNYD